MIITKKPVLSALADDGINANSPVAGWRSIVTISNVQADTEDATHPATDLANTSTALFWRAGDTSEQSITVTLSDSEYVDYLAIAGHNLGTIGVDVTIEGRESAEAEWLELSGATLPDDAPTIFRFTAGSFYQVRLRLGPHSSLAQIAVLYVGKLLVFQRRIYVSHTPITFGRDQNTILAHSENGQFLGQLIVGGSASTRIDMQNLTPSWYREHLAPMIAARPAFFFAWRPEKYPLEVGYVAISGNPRPTNQLPNGMMQVSIDVRGRVT